MGIDRTEYVDGYKLEYEWDGTEVTRRITQPRQQNTLLTNKELQKERWQEGAMGVHALSMDELDREMIGKLFPDINSPDAETRDRAWRKFIASPLSRPYRVSGGNL